jgi:hypothetical protein
MEKESPKEDKSLVTFLNSIFKINLLNELEVLPLEIRYKNDKIELKKDLYTFNTIQDLKYAIFESFGNTAEAAPNNQLLYYVRASDTIEAIDFLWDLPSKNIKKPGDFLNQFVSSSGAKQPIQLNLYPNYLLENRIRNPRINVLFYKDVISMFKDLPQPLSEKEFNGRIYPYFPHLKMNESYPNEKDMEHIKKRIVYNDKKYNFIKRVQDLLTQDLELIPQILTGFKYLKLSWYQQYIEEKIKTFFFELNVNDNRPYLRLLPVGSTPISKIHLLDIEKKIPNIFDLHYLENWSNEKNPAPERDFVMGKIAVPCTILNLPKVYATIRLFDDGSFDVIVEPPKDVRKLNPFDDFYDNINGFAKSLKDGIGSINRENKLPHLSKGNFIYQIKIPTSFKRITRKVLKERLALFSPFFQEIPPLPNEQPLVVLRYKCVNNFSSEDNISNFLTQVMNKNIYRDNDTMMSNIVELVSEEFQLDTESAREKVLNWFKKRQEVQKVEVGDKSEYTNANNTGIDIAIYEKHPFYSFHYMNIESFNNLQMVNTLLTLMFSLETDYFSVSKKDAQILEKITNEVELNEEAEADETEDNAFDFQPQFDFDFGEKSEDEEDEDKKSAKQLLKESIDETVEPMPVDEAPKPVEKEEELKGVANFFIRKLMEYDRRLFKYPITKPSDKSYVSQCSANETRQPSLLTPEQFNRMVEEYENDDVDFHIYPLKPGQKETVTKSSDPNNVITVLRYGSNPAKENYFVCSQMYCTRDDIVVLVKDFEGTKLRHSIKTEDGKTITEKPRNTCPFCMGKLIKDRKHPDTNETVLQRIYKPGSNKRQLWINFLNKIYHPEGLPLPCCFTSPKPIKFKDTQKGIKPAKDGEDSEDEFDDEDYIERYPTGEPIVEYITRLSAVGKKYIIGEEKMPLEITKTDGPQIGLVPKKLDSLFEQDSQKLVSRKGNLQILNSNVQGFLRVAVDNRTTYLADSFLSALAPFFLKNSAKQMKQRIQEVLEPRVFIQMNYGNLVLEFYDPKIAPIKNRKKLEFWANTKLGIQMNENNRLEIERIYKAYINFNEWLESEKTAKEYRHFSMILSQANLIQGRTGRAGTTVIIIDIHNDDSVNIRCPTYGYNPELMDKNDVIFLMHHYSGIYEPLFYVNTRTTEGIRDTDLFTLVFQKGKYNSWPDIVKKLYGEFRRSCSGPGKTVYTSQSHINSNALIPLSAARDILLNISQKHNNFFFSGILRDAYNHIAAVVCEERVDDIYYQVLVPVIDDGVLITDKSLVLNWNDFNVAPLEETVRIYKIYLMPFIKARYPGYALGKYAVSRKTESIIGLQLKNLLFIPVEEQDTKTVDSSLIIEVDEFEYDINRDIILKKDREYIDVESKFLNENELEEIYQHLRVSFANYLSGERGNLIKERLEEDIFEKKISLNEKRRRMMILFGAEVQSWLSTDKGESTFSFIRNDCRVQAEDVCKGHCVWAKEEGKCKIHLPETKEDGINIGLMLTLRLIDELIRFSEKRRELFENDIVRLVFFKKPIRIGDQYIVPENTLEWSDLLRVIWSDTLFEKPRFFEEISSDKKVRTTKEVDESENVIKPLNLRLKSYLNPEDLKTSLLSYLEITKEASVVPILYSLRLSETDITVSPEAVLFSADNLRSLTKLRKASFIQLNLTTDPVSYDYYKIAGGKSSAYPVYVIIIDKGSSGFLVKSNQSDSLLYTDLPDVLENIISK